MKFLGLSLVVLCSFSLFGATIIKKNGNVIKGDVIDQNENELKVKLPTDAVITIPKSDLLKISYQDLTESESDEIYKKAKESTPEAKPNAINVNQILKLQNDQILELTAEVISLSEELENHKSRIEKLESAQSQQKDSIPKKIQWSVVWRSAVFPGWGQFHWKENYWGSFYTLAFLGAGANYNDKWQAYQKAEKQYQNPLGEYLAVSNGLLILNFFPPIGGERSEVKEAARNSNEAVQILAGVYFLNLIDAFIHRPDQPKLASTDRGWDFSIYRESGFSPNAGQWDTGMAGNVQFRMVFE